MKGRRRQGHILIIKCYFIHFVLTHFSSKPSPLNPHTKAKTITLVEASGIRNRQYRIYNIGNNQSGDLMEYISTLEDCLGMQAQKEFLPLQMGDVPETYANIDDLVQDFGFRPKISLKEGIQRFVDLYLDHYGNLKA